MIKDGLPQWPRNKESAAMQEPQEMQDWSLGWEDPLKEDTAVLLPGESHGQRNLAGYSPEGHKKLDMTEVTEHTYTLQNLWDISKKKKNEDNTKRWKINLVDE